MGNMTSQSIRQMCTPSTCDLWKRVLAGPIGPAQDKWHWLEYNFTPGTAGNNYFTPLTLQALHRIDAVMPGYAEAMITRLEQVNGRPMNQDDYEAIRQWLAEVLVVDHLVRHKWPAAPTFIMEPPAPGSKKNPEILVEVPDLGALGVEVKCPNLRIHAAKRRANPSQLLDRALGKNPRLESPITPPRDLPLKDFLTSAQNKFEGFRAARPRDFQSVLFIVWDDYINEPISALSSPASGLLTPNTFLRQESGAPVTFPALDAVVLMRHQHQFKEGMANRPPIDQRHHFLDYGEKDAFPPHALIRTPEGQCLRNEWADALGAWPLEELYTAGAEYHPSSLVTWV